MNTFFTSDLHLGHPKVIQYSERPFKDVKEMDEALINNWNSVVSNVDKIFVLGDFSFHKAQENEKILKRLKGQKFLIKGNHDHKNLIPSKGFQWVSPLETVKVGDDIVVLCHFPILSWDRMHYGSWMLHGHCHGGLRLPRELINAKIMDVGVDSIATELRLERRQENYRPVEFEEVKAMRRNSVSCSVDYHNVRS